MTEPLIYGLAIDGGLILLFGHGLQDTYLDRILQCCWIA